MEVPLRIDSQNRFSNSLSNASNWVQKLRLSITDGVLLNDVATFDGTIFSSFNYVKNSADSYKAFTITAEITKINILNGKILPISGKGTNNAHPLTVQNGITGEGGIQATGNLYLGGTNIFNGPVIVSEGQQLILQDKNAIQNTTELVLGAGSSFGFITQDATSRELSSIKKLSLYGSSSGTYQTTVDGAAFNLSGPDAYLAIDDGATESSSGELAVNLRNASITLENGAALRINYSQPDEFKGTSIK